MKKQSRTVPRRRQSVSPTPRHLPLVDILIDTQAELQELVVVPTQLVMVPRPFPSQRPTLLGQSPAVYQSARVARAPVPPAGGGPAPSS